MTKSYYGFSFIISATLYATLGFFILAFLETPKKITKKFPQKVIKIAVITPKEKVIIPSVVIPKPPIITPPKKTVKPKKIVKKHKPKKVIKKKTTKKKVIKKKIIKKPKPKTKPKPKKIVKKPEPVVEEEYFIPTPTRVVEQPAIIYVPPPPQPVKQVQVAKVDKSAERKAFLRKSVRNKIKNNKKYPKMALRRHIEGSVGVMFDIGANGSVSNIRFLNGKSILQKSVRKAVTRSFPITIPSNLKSEFPMYNISVNVNFKIN